MWLYRRSDPTVRDRHIAQIRSNGRMAWQVATGYNQRSRIETQHRLLEERQRSARKS